MWCASPSSCRSPARRSRSSSLFQGPVRGPFSFLVLVYPAMHLAAEHAVRVHRVADDEGQDEEHADAEEDERALVGSRVPDRQAIHDHIREQAVGETDECEDEDRYGAAEWLAVRP